MLNDYNTKFLSIAFRDGTPKKAFLTACAVGTVLSQSFFGRENGRVLDKFMRPSWKTV